MAMKAIKAPAQDSNRPDTPPAVPALQPHNDDHAASTVVAPRPQAIARDLGDHKDVRELQAMIERAFALLDEVADKETPPAHANEPAPQPAAPAHALGAPPGSELKYRSSIGGRVLKTLAGLAVVGIVGLIPLQRVMTPVSNEAFVNAPVYTLRAPVDGVVDAGPLAVGAQVGRGAAVATIQTTEAAGQGTPVLSNAGGKVWDMLVQPGSKVAKGDVVARVVSCSATSVVASVSEPVYDKLTPGMAARFNFFGRNRFYYGTVATLLGHATAAADVATPAELAPNTYRVVVSMPSLGTIEDCAIGRRGSVVFGADSR
jgi:predicted deacylase